MRILGSKRISSFLQTNSARLRFGLATAIAITASSGALSEALSGALSGALPSALSTDGWSANGLPIAIRPAQAQMMAQTNWATLEQNLIAEHNRVRQNPQSYIPLLEARLASMNQDGNIPNGCGRNCTLLTNEGRSAVEEAIQALRNQPPVCLAPPDDSAMRTDDGRG